MKQNNQIAIAFLKKLCRISKLDRYREFLVILSEIEMGSATSNTSTKKIKEQIRKALKAIQISDNKTHQDFAKSVVEP